MTHFRRIHLGELRLPIVRPILLHQRPLERLRIDRELWLRAGRQCIQPPGNSFFRRPPGRLLVLENELPPPSGLHAPETF